MSSEFRTSVSELKYIGSEEESAGCFLRMDTNALLFGQNPAVIKVLKNYRNFQLNHYPTQNTDELRRALAEKCGLHSDNFIVGNGSNQIFDYICKTFINPGDSVITVVPTFTMYKIFIRVNLGNLIPIKLNENYSLPVEKILNTKAKMIIIASPNNPTGNKFSDSSIQQILNKFKGVVVIDEAYADFCGQDYRITAAKSKNIIVVRTFSKAFGLAGIRVGYAVANKEIISTLNKVKEPFNVNSLSEKIAICALENDSFVKKVVEKIVRERQYLKEGLEKLKIKVYPSDANFLLFISPLKVSIFVEELKKRKIAVRYFSEKSLVKDCIRVTVGTRKMNNTFLSALKEIVKTHS